MPLVEQPDWFEEYYKFKWDLCPDDPRGVDGPQGIEEYSKDLAFELWTTTGCTCFGDQDGNGVVTLTELLAFINIMQANGFADTAVSPGEECFDQDGNGVLTLTELLALINLLQPGGFVDVPCP